MIFLINNHAKSHAPTSSFANLPGAAILGICCRCEVILSDLLPVADGESCADVVAGVFHH